MTPIPPFQITPFQITPETPVIGTGAFGNVVKCTGEKGKEYAVKVLLNLDLDAIQNELNIIECIGTRHHSNKNIVRFFGFYQHNNEFHIVMECASERSMTDFVHRAVALGLRKNRETFLIFCQLQRGLDFLHSLKIIHCDIKPNNVLVFNYPEQGFVFKLADFGMSKFEGCKKVTCGTPLYLPPQLCMSLHGKDENTRESDYWALAVTMLFWIDGGRHFFNSLDDPLLKRIRYWDGFKSEEIEIYQLSYPLAFQEISKIMRVKNTSVKSSCLRLVAKISLIIGTAGLLCYCLTAEDSPINITKHLPKTSFFLSDLLMKFQPNQSNLSHILQISVFGPSNFE